ncbi:MAG: F0F1 ATP synthase subunit A [Flavobacteriales bacterium]|jgi:F-type H+-transporting ATPase subunit a|nr:F0F1 ATP synthase subunit A [Flavobacteriales bacterium]MBT5090407.1 F0F1 ATP synthase subunit A [Flavobacteriales bacterium]MBT5750537.1 F0F1 ATP synthase subunit A [Flavobacteriales bacterium]
MKKTVYKLIITSLLITISGVNVFAESQPEKKDGFNPTPQILHHIADSYEWHLWGNVSIPLPVILYSEGSFDVFMSSSFHHGKSKVTKGDRVYKIEHHHIVEENDKKIINLSITKNVASMILSTLILLFILGKTSRSYKRKKNAPKGLQSFLEPLILFVREDIIKSNVGPKHEKYAVFLLTVFFFILINNLLGLTPGAANVTGNISVTFVLSMFTFVIITISANKGYWKHLVKPPGTPIALLPIMIPIEIFGVFTKPFALMIRLFANITAGHIIIFSLISLIFVASNNGENVVAGWSVAPISVLFVLFIFLIEILVAFLQAYIFTLLSAVFIGLAVKEENH